MATTRYEIHTDIRNASGSWECISIEPGTADDFSQADISATDLGGWPGQEVRVRLIDPTLDGDARTLDTRELRTT